MSDESIRDEILDRCLTRLLKGDTVDQVLAQYPEHAAALRPALEAATALREAPAPRPSGAARQLAMSRMTSQLAAERSRPAPAGVSAWLMRLRARPLAYQAAALAGGLALFAGLGFGATAATGTTPEPVRTFFGLSQESIRPLHFNGSVVSVSETALVIDTSDGHRTVTIGATSVLRRGDARIAWSDLRVGERVDVTASERAGQLTASLVLAGAAPAVPAGAPAQPDRAPASPGIEDHGLQVETAAPHKDGTPETEDNGGDDDGGDDHGGLPASTSTAGHEQEDDSEDAPHATSTPGVATKTPAHEDDDKPASTRTSEAEHEDEHETPEPPEIEPTEDHSSDDWH
jgi:hypothetical protein